MKSADEVEEGRAPKSVFAGPGEVRSDTSTFDMVIDIVFSTTTIHFFLKYPSVRAK